MVVQRVTSLVWVWACCAVVTVLTSATGRVSGVSMWMDDGNGRTVLADLDAQEAKVLAQDMLDLLDLPSPPASVGRTRHHHRHGHRHNASAPTWMKTIYNTLDEHGKANAPNMDDVHRQTVTAADTIITFVSRDPPSGRPSHGANKRLYFDMNDVPLDHSLLAAEIQVHRTHGHEPATLHVYMVNDEQGTESKVGRVTLRGAGWVTVNVTTPVLSWLIFPETNFGLRLAVTYPGSKHEQHFHEVGLSGSHDEEEYRPFLVGFFALPDTEHKKKRIRTARSVSRPPAKSRPRQYRDVAERRVGSDVECQMKQLHVSFRDLGWENWVIAPEGYDANYCEGRCEFPLHAELKPTNHAIVQTLVKIYWEDGPDPPPPNACCAPINLSTIPVLYYSFDNNIVLKKYPMMIVKTCGCL